MPHTLDDRASLLLELMREADDEAVTLDELAIAGIEDPATALLALEQAGFGLERVIDTSERGREMPCVRLARPTWPIDEPAPTLEFAAVRPTPAPAAADSPPAPVVAADPHGGLTTTTAVLLALLSLGLAWLLRAALRGR
jgi:hypothetical protein